MKHFVFRDTAANFITALDIFACIFCRPTVAVDEVVLYLLPGYSGGEVLVSKFPGWSFKNGPLKAPCNLVLC